VASKRHVKLVQAQLPDHGGLPADAPAHFRFAERVRPEAEQAETHAERFSRVTSAAKKAMPEGADKRKRKGKKLGKRQRAALKAGRSEAGTDAGKKAQKPSRKVPPAGAEQDAGAAPRKRPRSGKPEASKANGASAAVKKDGAAKQRKGKGATLVTKEKLAKRGKLTE